MPNVIISAAAYNAIRGAARYQFKSTGKKLGDGSYNVRLSDETLERLDEHKLGEETISDTIVRVLNTLQGKN